MATETSARDTTATESGWSDPATAAITVTTTMAMAEAEAAVRDALSAQGFGVLTEIDVAATLKAKLDVDRPALKILGACNPGFANSALDIDESVSLLLPCNVVLSEAGSGTHISAVDPRGLMTTNEFRQVAADAAERLGAALRSVPA